MPQQACMRSTFIARINFDDTVLSQNKGLPFIYIFKEQETILYTTSEYILRTYMDTVCIHTCVCMYLWMYKCVCVCAQLLSHVRLFATLWTAACQPPLSMEFSGKNTGAGGHFLLQGSSWPRDRTCVSWVSCIAGRLFTAAPLGKPHMCVCVCKYIHVLHIYMYVCVYT